MRIGVDAMGGDFAPEAVVRGSILACKQLKADERIVLFGDKAKIDSARLGKIGPITEIGEDQIFVK